MRISIIKIFIHINTYVVHIDDCNQLFSCVNKITFELEGDILFHG